MFVWISTGGSHGDVHPYLAIGRELKRRGHAVVVSVHPYFKRDVEGAGLEHFPIGGDVDVERVMQDPMLMHPRHGGRTVFQLILDSAPKAHAALRDEFRRRRPDVLLAHHICLGMGWLARDLKLPFIQTALSPIMWLSGDDPIPPIQRRPGRIHTILARAIFPVMKMIARPMLDRRVNPLREALGYAPERNAFQNDLFSGDINLGLWSPHMRGATASDPPRSKICGFCWYDRSDRIAALPEALERFLAAGERPIVFALGTAAVHLPGDFYEVAVAVCTMLNRRGVLLVGREHNTPSNLPPTMCAVDYAPFSLLLPRAAATVHHGGIGSTAQAFRSGRPAVVVPHAHDQFHNALHGMRLGVAGMVPRHGLSASRLAAALDVVLSDPRVEGRAGELAARLRHEDGAAVVADEVERMAARGQGQAPAESSATKGAMSRPSMA